MPGGAIKQIKVEFAHEMYDKTELVIERHDEVCFDVAGHYQKASGWGFPAFETIERTGAMRDERVRELYQRLRASSEEGWYHHYCHSILPEGKHPEGSRWSICVTTDGGVERWEGMGLAPAGFDSVYQDLIAFGMPPLRLGRGNSTSFESVCGSLGEGGQEPWHITCYDTVLAMTASMPADGEDESPVVRYAREFIDDVGLYLSHCCPESLDETAFVDEWQIAETLKALAEVDVKGANRRHMMLLFGALVRLDPSPEDIAALARDGVLGRWCQRLREIPGEERKEQLRIEQHRRMELMELIDASVKKFAAGRTPFTSYDVAKVCGVSAQQVSGRIRGFVRRGELKPVKGTMPRKYQAA